MAICENKQNLLKSQKKNSRLMGLDVGEKTIGLALSDTRLMIASPMETVRRKKWSEDFKKLLKLLEEQQVFGLIIGLPLNMDGSEGPRCQSIRQLAENILKQIEIPICFWDERLLLAVTSKTLHGSSTVFLH